MYKRQQWDSLKTCIVGRAYPPEFFKWVTNTQIKTQIEKIAIETEEDFQQLIGILESFNVEVLRPEIPLDYNVLYNPIAKRYVYPPVNPGSYIGVIDDLCFFKQSPIHTLYSSIKEHNWTANAETFQDIDELSQIQKYKNLKNTNFTYCNPTINKHNVFYSSIKKLTNYNPKLELSEMIGCNFSQINALTVDDEIYYGKSNNTITKNVASFLKNKTVKYFDTFDDVNNVLFTVVSPNLIISSFECYDIHTTFSKDFEVIYLPKTLHGHNNIFNSINELQHWDVDTTNLNNNIDVLVVNSDNVIVNSNNRILSQVFNRHNINVHVSNFRHSHIWNVGLHSMTVDLIRS